MKALLFILLAVPFLFSYEEGDTLDNSVLEHLSLDQDKVYVVDFFASWCGSCQKEIPLISRAKTQTDETKVEFVGVDADKNVQKGIAFQKKLQEAGDLNFRVVNDPQNLLISEFNPKGMPTLYFIKDAKVLKITTGAVDDIDEHILEFLKGVQ